MQPESPDRTESQRGEQDFLYPAPPYFGVTTSEALPSDEVPPSRGRGCLSAVGWALVAAGALLILAALVLLVIHRVNP